MSDHKETEIIQKLKDTYGRDLRKLVVKSILADEKEKNTPNYTIINQIFFYVRKELQWKMADQTKEWDKMPFRIMAESFPKIESTKWFKKQILAAKKMIDVGQKG